MQSYALDASLNSYLYRYNDPSFNSYGSIGLIQMPNSRFLDEGSAAVTYSDYEPYKRISLVAYPFSWLEAIYQYTDISNKLYSDSFLFSGNQTYKDKGFDVKFRLLKETNILPQVSVGLRDIGGTGLFSSEYLVFSKFFNNIDFTLGVGWGVLSKGDFSNPLGQISEKFDVRGKFSDNPNKGGEFSTDSFFRGEEVSLFGGIELFLDKPKNFRFKLEYDSTDYENEGFSSQKVDSRINTSLIYSASENLSFSIGHIRGNTLNFSFSIAFNASKKNNLLKRIDNYKPEERRESLQNVTSRDKKYFYRAALKYLGDNELYLRTADINQDTATVSFAQNKYLSYPVSYGRAIRVLDDISPRNIQKFRLIPVNSAFEITSLEFNRNEFNYYEKVNDHYALLETVTIEKNHESTKSHEFKPKTNFPRAFYELGPDFQSHIGGPDRFFVGGLNLRLDSEVLINRNLSLQSVVRQSIYTSFDVLEQPSDSILPHVRTDIIEYLNGSEGISITRLQLNYFHQPSKNTYLRLSTGIFEEMFSGYGTEFLYRPFYKNYAIGIEFYRAKQRSYRQLFSSRDYEVDTGHITYYQNIYRNNLLLKIIGGKYLAGDSGITFDISKRFKSGMVMGVFASKTDISSFEFGEGSFDKGFYINVPLESLFSSYSRQQTGFGLRPVTRDGAAKLMTGHDLYGVTDQASFGNIYRDFSDIYD